MNKLDVQKLLGSRALPPAPTPKQFYHFFSSANCNWQTDPSLSTDYTSKAPVSSSTRLPPPHVSPQKTQGEKSHCARWGKEEQRTPVEETGLFDMWAPLKDCWCTPEAPRGSAATASGCTPTECSSNLKWQLRFWTSMWPAPQKTFSVMGAQIAQT